MIETVIYPLMMLAKQQQQQTIPNELPFGYLRYNYMTYNFYMTV